MIKIELPLTREVAASLKAGEEVLLSGEIYSARDQAHLRLVEIMERGEELPVNLENQVIYYMGPAPTPEGEIIGSCGPTTASRMDAFTPQVLARGVRGIIGKGNRAPSVYEALKDNGSVYFYAFGGCGALYADKIESQQLVAFEDLGPEAIYLLKVKNFPAIVAIDTEGNTVFV